VAGLGPGDTRERGGGQQQEHEDGQQARHEAVPSGGIGSGAT
jgi:hypothetical protein